MAKNKQKSSPATGMKRKTIMNIGSSESWNLLINAVMVVIKKKIIQTVNITSKTVPTIFG